MEQVIYADVLFAVNFSMDFLSLYIASRITHGRVRVWPTCLAAALGALYATAVLFADTGGAAGVVINIAVAWLMCYICFGGGGGLICRTAIFYGVGFLLGGVMTALYSLLGRLGGQTGQRTAVINGDAATLSGSMPLALFVLLAGAASMLSLVIGRLYERKKSAPTAELELRFEKRRIVCTALCDSGNLLREPITGAPVIFICKARLCELVERRLAELMLAAKAEELGTLPPERARRLCLIPLSGINEKRIALGLRVDAVLVNGAEKSAVICCTARADYGGRDALLPSGLL